ncbi:MOSC domain-containing protein [Brucella ceti TE28753-12]|nr:MOSC domain-containing protein [Brucella ceti TE28753-12]
MAVRVQKTGRTGWYYRVLEEGHVEAGETMRLIERLSPEWTLHRIWHLLYVDMLNYDELALMAAIPHLADGWKRHAVNRSRTARWKTGHAGWDMGLKAGTALAGKPVHRIDFQSRFDASDNA